MQGASRGMKDKVIHQISWGTQCLSSNPTRASARNKFEYIEKRRNQKKRKEEKDYKRFCELTQKKGHYGIP